MICILSVIKDEHRYLEEWIRYHIDIGIDTLFLLEDVGSKSHQDICSKFGDKVVLKSVLDFDNSGEIIRKKKEGYFLQGMYFKKGLELIHDNFNYDWCFLLDADEFITPVKPFPDLLKAYEAYDAVLLYWKNFGASGHIKTPSYDRPIFEIFNKECDYTAEDWKHRHISKMCFNMHKFKSNFVYGGHTALCNWVRTDFKTSRQDNPTFENIYIRHYMTRSWEEYKWKLEQRGYICPGHRKISDFFEMNKDMIYLKDELLK